MDVEIPANTTATIFIPADASDIITESGVIVSQSNELQLQKVENGYVPVKLGSGMYHFVVTKK